MCTAIQIALVDLLSSLNIKPAAVTGHSSGEIAAAYAAGALTQESALTVSYHRGLAVASIKKAHYSTKGAMLAVGLSQAEAETILLELKCGKAVIACYNSPTSLTISGDEEAISELHSLLQERNKFSRKLVVDVAYHSHHMKLVADQYLAAIQKIETQSSTSVEIYSSVTGDRAETSALDPKYWVDNMLNPVRFSDALRDLCLGVKSSRKRSKRTSAAAVDIIIEIGPHSALAGPIKQIIKSDSRLSSSSLAYLPTLIRQRDAVETLQTLAGRLYERGWTIDMAAVNGADDLRRRRLLVDLPPYPWNHTTSYWAESRESQRYRLRPHPRSDLLGVQVRQSSSVEPQWRNLIRPAEIPWIRDHKVENNIVYPAAGFLVMAIEAAFQRAITPEANIRGYDLREIAIGSALVIPETSDEVEVFFSLRPYNENSRSSSSTWEEFRIFSSSDDGNSIEHCRGLISVRKGSPGKGVDIHRSWQQQHVLQRQQWEAVCTNAVDVNEMYDSLRRIGLEYGPTFARVTSACHGLNKAVGIVSIPDTASIMPSHFEYPFILHPSTLDSCFHTFFPAMMSQQGNLKQPVLPTFISNMSVSHNIVRTPGHELAVCAESVGMGYRRTTSSLAVFDTANVDPSPVIVIDGMVTTSITKAEGTDTNQSQRRLCFYTQWDSDPDLLSAEQVIDLCTHIKPPLEESEHVKTLEQAAYYYVERALMQTSVDDVPKMQPHHQKLYAAIKEFRESVHNRTLDYDTTSWPSATEDQRDLILERVKTSGDEGRLLAHVGENLGAIFKQEVEPLSVMMADNRLENYYRNNARMARQYEQAATYISLLAHKNPHLKILEIGAGTGGASFVILKALGGTDGTLPRFASYDYTDISTGFFEKSKEKAAPWGDLVAFRKFDIETDPSQQGFELGSYDLVVAANVLHATKYMERTMSHVRQLLKAGGSLVLTELTRKKASMAVLFGILPGWWMGKFP
jgi:acyl transferase domain-containing protein